MKCGFQFRHKSQLEQMAPKLINRDRRVTFKSWTPCDYVHNQYQLFWCGESYDTPAINLTDAGAPLRRVRPHGGGIRQPPIQYHSSVKNKYRQQYLPGSPAARKSNHIKQQWGGLE